MMVVEVWKRQSQKDDDGGLGFRGVFWEFDII